MLFGRSWSLVPVKFPDLLGSGLGSIGGKLDLFICLSDLSVRPVKPLLSQCLFSRLVLPTEFAALLRRVVLDRNDGDEKWLKQLSHAGFSDEDVGIIHAAVCSRARMEEEI